MVNLLAAFSVPADASGYRPPKETVNSRVIALGLFGCMAAVMYGYDTGFIGGTITLPGFIQDFGLKSMTAAQVTDFSSNIVATFQAGAVFGALLSSFLSDRIGRRKAIIANFAVYFIGAVLMTASADAAAQGLMYTGRALTGWGVGASSALVPVYVAECAPPHIRGRLVGLYEVGVQVGVMIGFWIPYATLLNQSGSIQWRLPVSIQLIPAGVCLIALVFLRESPRYVVKHYGSEQALTIISYLRGLPQDHEYCQHELADISAQIEHERQMTGGSGHGAVFRETFGRSNARRLFTGVMIMVFFQMAGTNAVNYYSPLVFQSLGVSASSAKLFATGVYGVIRFVATLIAMVLFTDRFGRKSMIVTGGSIMALCMWIIGALIKTNPPTPGQTAPGAGQYAAIVLIFVWAVAFCFSYAGIPWIYCAEIFPLRIRSLNMAICSAVHWAFNLMIGKATPYMIQNLGGYGIYFVFGACSTVGAIWQYFCMPETKGKTLEEIEALFDPSVKLRGSSTPDRRSSMTGGEKPIDQQNEMRKESV